MGEHLKKVAADLGMPPSWHSWGQEEWDRVHKHLESLPNDEGFGATLEVEIIKVGGVV